MQLYPQTLGFTRSPKMIFGIICWVAYPLNFLQFEPFFLRVVLSAIDLPLFLVVFWPRWFRLANKTKAPWFKVIGITKRLNWNPELLYLRLTFSEKLVLLGSSSLFLSYFCTFRSLGLVDVLRFFCVSFPLYSVTSAEHNHRKWDCLLFSFIAADFISVHHFRFWLSFFSLLVIIFSICNPVPPVQLPLQPSGRHLFLVKFLV